MQNLKTKLRNIARENLPESIYGYLYKKINFKRGETDLLRLESDSRFVNKGFYDFKLDDVSFKIFLDPRNGGVDYEIFANKNFEPGVLAIFKKELDKEDIFLDVGANIGQHSIYASRFCKRVYAFEPIKRLYKQFTDSVFENDILNIQILNYALGDKKEILEIYSNEINMGASSVFVNENRTGKQTVKVLNFDRVYNSLGLDRVDFVKIDVEGYELNVLLGMKDAISKDKPKILVEYSPCFYNKVDDTIGRKIYNFLRENNYQIFDVDNDGSRFVEVKDFSQIENIGQTNLFCKYI